MCWATRKEWRVLTIKLNFVFLQRSFSRALVGFCVCLKIVYTWFAVFLVDLCVCVCECTFPSEAFMCKLVLLVVNKVDKQHNSNRTTDTLGPRWWRVDRVVGRSVGWLARIHFETPFIHLLYLLPLALVWLSIERKKFIHAKHILIIGLCECAVLKKRRRKNWIYLNWMSWSEWFLCFPSALTIGLTPFNFKRKKEKW